MKKYSLWCLLMLVGGVVWWWVGRGDGGDYKLGVIWDEGMGVVSISLGRRMVNSMELDGQTQVWVPGGLGWYQSDKIKKLLDQENKRDIAGDIFFYNLGFLTDRVVFLDDFSWDKMGLLMSDMGFFDWLEYSYWREQLMFKEDKVESGLFDLDWYLDEVMVRDFADSRVLNEDLRLVVFNTTDDEGLANFLANRLSWVGFLVTEVGSVEEEITDCRLSYGLEVEDTYGWSVLSTLFDCEEEKEETLGDFEVEMYIGEGFSQMIKYNGYVRTF